ncbi:hypothetical protein SLIQ_18495 [Serratia liquefaciens FK01]|nr:hypothetical protein SLIQ_18495 [Serratia liquefaciens FK01]
MSVTTEELDGKVTPLNVDTIIVDTKRKINMGRFCVSKKTGHWFRSIFTSSR